MKIEITEQAQKWFENELGVGNGLGVRFLGKVYGKTDVHEGFSLGIEVAEPEDPIAQVTYNDITYFAEKQDEWFFTEYDLKVTYNEERNEPVYHFVGDEQ
ncbi:HesB/YadR/YfhF family protein [Atopococcus tabaci]|uniref:HesB/YadR/YfhF family protein n=1 Tax=Atopococcus tabaci TaxID=269774 RepID=UPI00240A77FD|nr:iron-sulfur cluster biosynthesis protein [Atopococcus tabaci]